MENTHCNRTLHFCLSINSQGDIDCSRRFIHVLQDVSKAERSQSSVKLSVFSALLVGNKSVNVSFECKQRSLLGSGSRDMVLSSIILKTAIPAMYSSLDYCFLTFD